jgi:hypothetical protein
LEALVVELRIYINAGQPASEAGMRVVPAHHGVTLADLRVRGWHEDEKKKEDTHSTGKKEEKRDEKKKKKK